MANQIKTLPTKPELEFKFIDGKDRKMISVRLPEALLNQIEKIAERTGWTKTELVQYALDQFVQAENRSK